MNRIKKNLPLIIVASSIMMAFILIITKPDEAKIEVEKFIPKINTLLMKPQDFSLFINSEGYIKSMREFPLLPEVSGKVLYLSAYFNNNLIFDRGDTLVRIDSTNYSIARRNAKAKRDVARLENLQQKAIKERSKTELGNYNDSKVSDLAKKIPQLQSSNSLLDAAEANYDNAELNIEKTIILAPFKGRVKNNYVSKGMYVNPSMKLASIYSTEDMFVKLPLSIDDSVLLGLSKRESSIIAEDTISVHLKALVGSQEYDVEGKYIGVSGSVDKMTQKIYLNVEINSLSPDLIIDDNLFVNAKIYGKEYKGVFLIPNEAIIENKFTYLVKNSRIYKREIEILKKYKEYSVIAKGIKGGDVVCLTRLDYYVDDMEIEVLK